jgi:hypothetical protein
MGTCSRMKLFTEEELKIFPVFIGYEVNSIICLEECATEIEFPGGCFPAFSAVQLKRRETGSLRKLFCSVVRVREAEDGKYIEFCLLHPLHHAFYRRIIKG